MPRWKLCLADLGGTVVSTGVFYAYGFLSIEVSLVFVGAMAAYVLVRRYGLGY